MSGGNTSAGQKETSGKGIEAMNAGKYRKRYEMQVEANNLLSDRLRQTRSAATKHMNLARQYLATAREEIVGLKEQIAELEGRLAPPPPVDHDGEKDETE